MLTQNEVKKLLNYDKRTGVFKWRVRPSPKCRVRAGDAAGCLVKEGYVKIKIKGKSYAAHNLAWLYVTGAFPVLRLDHENRIKNDNSFNNLRPATVSQNAHNVVLHRSNTSGAKGIYKNNRDSGWRATLTVNQKTIYVGNYFNKLDAVIARNYHGIHIVGEHFALSVLNEAYQHD